MITINIPTTFSEIKNLIGIKKSKRLRHNQIVIVELSRKVFERINDGYFDNDISTYFRKIMAKSGDKGLYDLFVEAYDKIK